MAQVRGGRGILVMHPRSYKESAVIGDAVRNGFAVLVDLSELDPEPSRQLVDFVSGLIFGLQGNIDRVTAYVLLVAPPGVTVVDDSGNLTGTFFNQF